MTTFAELYDLTVEQTRKPELVDITNLAIRTAVLRAHHVDFFPLDLQEGALTYAPSTAIYYDFPTITTTLLRNRALKTIRGLEAVSYLPVENFEWRGVDDLYTSEGVRRTSVYTQIGTTLRVYPALATGRLAAFFYQNPDTASATFSSWIADMYPDQLAMWAAQGVWARTGFREMANATEDLHVKPFREQLINSHILGEVN